MRTLVLGSAAGGGFPQWNCGCSGCDRARTGDTLAPPRTQSSIAVCAEDPRSDRPPRWVLINASPDLGQQLFKNPAMHPQDRRHSPIAAVLVTNADVDHVAGLLTLREGHRFNLYATERVTDILSANSIFNVLPTDRVPRKPIPLNQAVSLQDTDGVPLGLEIELFAVPGKIALWLEDPSQANFGSQPEDTVGVRIRETHSGKCMFYIPGCAAMPDDLAERLRRAALVLFDGTTYTDTEMGDQAVGVKTAQRMGHMCMDGPDGSVVALAPLQIERSVFVHINNTNPVLCADTPERRAVEAAGWSVAYDGMEIAL